MNRLNLKQVLLAGFLSALAQACSGSSSTKADASIGGADAAGTSTDASATAVACKDLCEALVACGEFASEAECATECDPLISTCTQAEVEQVEQCVVNDSECVALSSCLDTISCFEQ